MPCYVVFLKDRVIIAHLSPQRHKAEAARASRDIKDGGAGFFKHSAEMMRYWANYHRRYYSMTPAQILAEEPGNFSLLYQDIKKVLFRCESMSADEEGRTYGSSGKLKFYMLDGKKEVFSHKRSHSRNLKETLTKLLNGKLKYKK